MKRTKNPQICDDMEVRRVCKNMELAKFDFHVSKGRGVSMLCQRVFLFSSKNGDDQPKRE